MFAAHDVLRPALAQSDLYNILGMGLINISFGECKFQFYGAVLLVVVTEKVGRVNGLEGRAGNRKGDFRSGENGFGMALCARALL
jgi:hypothetical protein